MSERTIQDLWQLQGLPLNLKIRMTKDRIRQWIQTYGEDGVYVSFSGGKDSTVLLDLVRQDWPNVPGMFVDTGLEFPQIRDFVRQHDNIEWVKPKMNFKAVIQKYGYPFISKEVSECVYGARKYLTSVMEQNSIDRQTDRQTDRQSLRIGTDWRSSSDQVSTRMEEAQRYRSLADNQSLQKQSGGGYDNKYRKLRGLGLYSSEASTQHISEPDNRQLSDSTSDGDSSSERQSNDGEYP